VSDSLEEKPRVAKVNADLLLQLLERLREGSTPPRVVLLRGLCYEPAFSWMYSQA
jgi:hypothetical protein